MSRFLKLFDKDSEYQEAVTLGQIELPNVSFSRDTDTVHYNPLTWTDELLDSDGYRLLDSEGYTLIVKQKQFL